MNLRRLAAFAAALACVSCDGKKPAPAPAPGSATQATAAQEEGRQKLPVLGRVPEFVLVDAEGRPLSLDQMAGHVWVADFVFTKCSGICLEMTAAMAELQEAARSRRWDDVRLISLSVDPETDRPATLAAYAAKHKADPARWRFLTGSRDAIWKLCREGFKLPVGDGPASAEMPIFHGPMLALVDRDARIRGYYDGTTAEGRAAALRDLEIAVSEAPARVVQWPDSVRTAPWLDDQRKAQLAAPIAPGHDFRFEDRIADSGITFMHHVVDDAAIDFKACHYDHGTAVAAADVDRDGRTDLLFVDQIGRTELWRNLGGGRFEDATSASGITQGPRIGVGASFADTDNDGDADLLLTTVRGGNLFFENDGKGRFRDATATSGLGYSGHSSGGVFFDFDRDGLLDLWLCNVGRYTKDEKGRGGFHVAYADAFAGHLKEDREEPGILYRNAGGNVFKDVTAACGIAETCWNGDAVVLDANDDGFPDLYLLDMQGPDVFLQNAGGKTFVDRSRELFAASPWGSMGVEVLDFDGDGLLDLLVTDMHTDMAPPDGIPPERENEKIDPKTMFPESFVASDVPLVLGNALYRNLGGGKFAEISDAARAETFWPWGVSAGDLNADGFEDVFVTAGMGYPWRYGGNAVLLNDAGRAFARAEFVLGVEPRRGGRTAKPWFELECGGKDAKHARTPPAYRGRAVVWGSLSSRSSAILDLDDDGDLDVVVQEFGDFPQVLLSDLASRRPVRHLKVTLAGTKSNAAGIGARVVVVIGNRRLTQVLDGKSGYLAQSVLPLYFGLGEAEQADRIEVSWPSGARTTLPGPVRSGTRVRIEEK